MTNTEKRYEILPVTNEFGAPVYYIEETTSTMTDARILAAAGAPDGSVISAGCQTAGRGRIDGRVWHAVLGENVLCTVILRRPYEDGFTLRVGLGVAAAVRAFLPENAPVCIKWPNDILVDGKKITGILCESDGECLYVGIGCNRAQCDFPLDIKDKATSLALLREQETGILQCPSADELLTVMLRTLKESLDDRDWQAHVSALLYQKDMTVRFVPGIEENGITSDVITGVLRGIGRFGELLIETANPLDPEKVILVPCISGELQFLS